MVTAVRLQEAEPRSHHSHAREPGVDLRQPVPHACVGVWLAGTAMSLPVDSARLADGGSHNHPRLPAARDRSCVVLVVTSPWAGRRGSITYHYKFGRQGYKVDSAVLQAPGSFARVSGTHRMFLLLPLTSGLSL